MIKQLFFLTFFFISYVLFSQCDLNQNQGPMIANPDGSYEMQLIGGEISLQPFDTAYDTLTAMPHAIGGDLYEAVIGVRVPTDTSFVYDLGTGPTLYEDVQINTISINDILGLPMGFSWECVGGVSDSPDLGSCAWTGGQYGCIRVYSNSNVDPMLAGSGMQAYPLNVVLDVSASYEVFGFPFPVDVTEDELVNYFVLVIEDGNSSSSGDILDVRKFNFLGAFPNPATDHFTVQYGNDIMGDVNLKIYDVLGNLIVSNDYHSELGYNEIIFDTNKLRSGIYTFTLSNGSEFTTERIIIK
jgi:hypothetical protein